MRHSRVSTETRIRLLIRNVLAGIIAAGGILAAILAAVIISGYVLTMLWLWFVVPIFHIQALTIPQALGLSMLINFFLRSLKTEAQKEMTFTETFLTGLFHAALTLGIGWIIHLFV